jgi:transposase
LKEKGWQPSKIAKGLGVSRGAVSQWFKQAEQDGVEALYHRSGGGPKPRLSEEQLQQLPEWLNRGAEAYGFRGDVWTRPRLAEVIKREFGVSFTPQHVGNLLGKIGWSRQKPIERASQRDETAIEQWRTQRWPELKKKRTKKGGR